MASRILTLLLIALLTLPATVAGPPEASPQARAAATDAAPTGMRAQDEVIAAAKKKKRDKPKFRTITTIVRQPLTQTFTDPALIDVPIGTTPVKANPYPALIDVAGFANGTILDVDVILNGFTWSFPNDADILLAAAHLPAANAMVLSDVCGTIPVTNLTLTLDDEAAAGLSAFSPPACVSGTFKPTDIVVAGGDNFPLPAPIPSGNSLLSVFDGANPNGTWQLFVVDDVGDSGPGSIANGWSLTITALVDVPVTETIKKDKKGKKRGKQGRR